MSAKRSFVIAILLAALGALAISTPSEARIRNRRPSREPARESFNQRGFQLYAGLGGQGYEIEDNDYAFLDDRGSEGMFFLGAAIGLSKDVSLFLEGAGSQHQTDIGDVVFGYTHIGLKVAPTAGNGRSWQPYGKISAGGMFLLEDDHPNDSWHHHDRNGYTGPSVALTVGIDKFLSRHAALYGELGAMMGRLETRIIDGQDHDLAHNVGVTSARLQFGIRVRL